MNIQRLKFAWARGARIQIKLKTGVGNWVDPETSAHSYYWNSSYEYRIHPKDAHLEYGPVSTALRDMALYTDSVELDVITEMFMDLAGSSDLIGNWINDVDSGMCRLFFAEMLADEGL